MTSKIKVHNYLTISICEGQSMISFSHLLLLLLCLRTMPCLDLSASGKPLKDRQADARNGDPRKLYAKIESD